jgi:antitoxin ParD1/3/4
MNISITEQMKQWVESQVESGKYANASDYLRDLIRHDQEIRQGFDALLLKGLESGSSMP